MDYAPERPRPPPNRRRDKPQLSCYPCRQRKLKCDRQHPCGTCSRRSIVSSCNYATSCAIVPDAPEPTAPQRSVNLQSRLSELEHLVVSLMRGQGLPSPPVSESLVAVSRAGIAPTPGGIHEQAETPTDPGTLNFRDSGASYVQSVHWESILTKVRGLREDLVTSTRTPIGSHLFYGPTSHATRVEILAAVPPRSVVDRLIALHFNTDTYVVTAYLIHDKKFLREYEAFWEDAPATSIAWIGLLFSMLYMAAQLQASTIDVTDAQAEERKSECLAMKDLFRERAVQCLVLARYTSGGPHILETLITILTGEAVLFKDRVTDSWLGISMILHIAIRMGYHRDPGHFPGISVFDGEMRRRIWTTILQLDLVLSLDMGLPRNATDSHIDTKHPLNLRDSDFDEDTTVMPPPRPETEWTAVLPLIARRRLISALGLICDVNTKVNPATYDEIDKIDALLEDVHKNEMPPVLRWPVTTHAITDSPGLVVHRISIETTYYKARILLYRRALIGYTTRQPSERDKNSVRICLDSALKILSFQEMLHEESQPFGRLYQLRWKVVHIFNQDVLLATSVLCLYLQDVDKFESPDIEGGNPATPRTEDIRSQLRKSHKIWLQMSSTSAEAGKVAKALSVVLGGHDPSTETGSGTAQGDFFVDFDSLPMHEFGATFENQYFSSGFYSPLTFFDNVLETRGS